MSRRFKPSRFAATGTVRSDPDADWMCVAEKLPLSIPQANKKRELYIPAIPRTSLRLLAAAGDALELLLVALAEMRMRGTREIAIGPRLWAQVGDPSKRVRSRLLRQVALLPPSICRLTARKGRPHLLVAGQTWPAAMRGPR